MDNFSKMIMETNLTEDVNLTMEGNLTISLTCNQSTTGTGSCSTAAGATILSPTIMFLAGIFGNVLALITLHKTRTDVRTTKFYTLVTGLVWTDLMGILMTSPSVLAAYVNGRQWRGGDAHCRFHGFAMTCFGIATPLIICAMAVERFLALKCVFFYSSKCKNGTARGLVLLLWMFVICYGLLPLFGFGSFDKQYPGTWCFLDFHSFDDIKSKLYAYFYASVNLLLLVIMLVCNGYVMATLCHARFRRMSDVTVKSNVTSEKSEMLEATRSTRPKQFGIEGQMIALMFALTTVFVLCWAPLMIQIIVTMATRKANLVLDLAAVRLASLNQTLDPWLYIIVRRSLITKLRSVSQTALVKLDVVHRHHPDTDENIHIIGQPKESASHNNNIREVSNVNKQVNGEMNACDIFSRPDVTRDGVKSNLGNRCLQLPDVTNTGDTGYVCKLHFGGSSEGGEEEGIYVKISFLAQRSACDLDSNAIDEDSKCDVARTNSLPAFCQPKSPRRCTQSDTENTRTTLLVTKETTSGNSLVLTNTTSPQPKDIPDVLHVAPHDSLRKTMSTT